MRGKFFFAALAAITVLTAAGAPPQPLKMTVRARADKHVPATVGYVLLLIEETAPTMAEAKHKCDEKLRIFSEAAQKEFPGIEIKAASVNFGNRSNSYGSERNQNLPRMFKSVIVMIPPDEELAMKLLDLGTRLGVSPLCTETRYDGYSAGAVFFGLRPDDKAITELYADLFAKLRKKADDMAKLLSLRVVGETTIDITETFTNDLLRFSGITIPLPTLYHGNDKDRVFIMVIGSGEFELAK